jgi:hypothetical protein
MIECVEQAITGIQSVRSSHGTPFGRIVPLSDIPLGIPDTALPSVALRCYSRMFWTPTGARMPGSRREQPYTFATTLMPALSSSLTSEIADASQRGTVSPGTPLVQWCLLTSGSRSRFYGQ